ncbi:hypothetical protein APHAL10511_006793 [Amanita phalloides]|nr:hypothetical protein APHAL10511_006793 [Amanita phalloides]
MDSIQHPRASSVAGSPIPSYKPTNDDIEAVIQMATSGRPTPEGRPLPPRDTRTQLFVGNLPYRVRWQDLKDLFRRAGTVLRADVSLGPDNRSRGYGTVLLATAEDAGRAVDMFNGYSWQTRILEVRPDRLPSDLDSTLGNISGPALTGHSSSVSSLVSLVPSAILGPLPPSNLHRRSDEFDYGSSISAHDVPAAASSVGRSLFVGNLPFHCQWQDLKDLFRQAGTIIRADVALGPDGRSRGFGTVIFASEFDAERAMNLFNGFEYNGRTLKVHFDKFTQSGQTVSHPASPSLHSVPPPATSLTPTALNNLSNASLFGSSYPQVSQAQVRLHPSYNPEFALKPPSPPAESYPAVPQQRVPRPLAIQLPSTPDISAISMSLGSMRLANETVTVDSTPLKQSPASESASSSTSSSVSRAPSVAASVSKTTAEKAASPSGSLHYQHPYHPGPITLPPPPPVLPLALHKISSQDESTPSVQTPVFNPQFIQHQQAPMTPHGLPPITPSMPPFTFLPPPLSPRQYPSQAHVFPDTPGHQTYASSQFIHSQHPSPLDHPSSPSYGAHYALSNFTPGAAMSPGAFWGRPGNPNPHINPAVGAPVHASHTIGTGHYVHSPGPAGRGGEPTSYFDLEYFPREGAHPPYVSSSLANEILRENDELNYGDAEDDDLEGIHKIDGSSDANLSEADTSRSNLNTSSDAREPGRDGQSSTESDSVPLSSNSSLDELVQQIE